MSLPAPDIRAKAAEELVGQTLADRFHLDSILGHGAMGVVFKAHHSGLKKDVALKLLHPELTANDEMVARFNREAEAVSRLDHPNCVRIMDFGSTDDGRRYLVMEYLEGEDLAALITEPMPPFRVSELVRQVLEGLAHAHAQGLVHRDIKPENIFVMSDENGERVKLLDFGIAKVTHGAGAGPLTQAGMVFGTPHYMSPERARGEKTDARSDLYALGVVMYSMLAGKLPFDGDDAVVLLRRQIKETPPPLPTAIPASLRRYVMQLLAKKPEERFPDAPAALAALRRAASPTRPPAKPKLPPPPKLPRPSSTRPKPPVVDTAAVKKAAEAPKAESEADDTEFPPLDELVELETKADSDDAGPPSSTPTLPGGADDAELEDLTADEAEPEPTPPPAPTPAAATTTEERPPWLLPAIGVGALFLIVIIVAAWPDGDDVESDVEAEAVAVKGTPKDESASGAEGEDREGAADDELVIDDETPDAEPATEEGDAEPQSKRALRATLASIDALIDSKEYEPARITIGPLLEVYSDEPELHLRMGRVLVALSRKANATAALESYRMALSLKPALLEDEAFAATFWDLLDDPRHRELAATIAIELLGAEGHDRLAGWVNVQKGALPYTPRRAAVEHLRAAGQGKRINEPLQTALDLWQAETAESPCDAFDSALDAATDSPDSYLLGTLANVAVPTTGEGDEAAACPGLEDRLTTAREEYTQRYAGIDPAVPSEYRRRKSSGRSNNRRRRR